MKILPKYKYQQFAKMTGKSRRTIESWAMQGKVAGLKDGEITLAGVKAHFGMTTAELRELDIDIDPEPAPAKPVPAA